MKNLFITFLIMFSFLSTVEAQKIIENPEKSLSSNDGRILQLKEELRITDEDGEFFFSYPSNVKVAPDGSIFMSDREMLLRFDENGKYIHNFFKKGQGPGEINYLRNYVFNDGNLIIVTSNPIKIITFSFEGELLDEVSLHESYWFLNFQFLKDQRFFFFKNDRPDAGDQPGVVDAPYILMSMDMKGQNVMEHFSLPYQFFMTAGASSGLGRLTSIPYKNKFLVISNTEDYLVKLYDLSSYEFLRSFKRKYKRIKPPEDYRWGGIYSRDGKRMGPPPPKYFNDINAFYIVNDRLWVRTSTRDDERGYLIDVFDIDGRFVDSFYLNSEVRGIISTHGDLIFIRETNEDDLVSVVKYRIVE